MAITISNEAPFTRREHVIYGSEESTPCTCMVVPGGAINVALVEADPGTAAVPWHEAVPAENDGHSGTFERHEAVATAFNGGLIYRMTLNGRTTNFEVAETVTDHPRVRRIRWVARDPEPVSRGTCILFTDEFHRQATIRFELLFFYENLTAHTAPVPTLRFEVVNVTNLRELKIYHAASLTNLFQGYSGPVQAPGQIKDAAGGYWEGCLPFETPTMAANRTTNPEAVTQSAQLVHPLYAGVPHATWGLWNEPPLNTTQAQRDTDFLFMRQYRQGAGDPVGNPQDPFRHLGCITNQLPRGAGAQSEFGAWTHVYSHLRGGLPVSGIDSRSMWAQHTAAMRHINRPVWYTETNGEPLSTSAHTYPDARVFDEMIWWNPSPPDPFRRATGRGNGSGDIYWMGHDVEHVGWNALVDDFLLHGSLAARHMLISIQSNMSCHHVDSSGFSESRSVGRWGMAAAQCYRATGNSTALMHYLELWPQVRTNWLARCAPTDPFRPYVSPNRSSSLGIGFEENSWIWVAWQSGILIAGLDAVLRIDDDLNFLGATIREQMIELQVHEAKALVNLAFAPAYQCGQTIYPNATRWATHVKFGVGLIPVCPTALDYCNATGLGRDVSFGGFSVSWVMMGVRIARRIDPTLAARCDLIEGLYRPEIEAYANIAGNTRYDKHPQYLGTN